MNIFRIAICFVLAALVGAPSSDVIFSSVVQAQETTDQQSNDRAQYRKSTKKSETDLVEIKLADDQLVFMAPRDWEKVKPRSRILEAELKVPASEDGAKDGRLTIMRAGGSIPANIARWKGQFSNSSANAKTEKETVAGKTVHFVDIGGTFMETMGGGPFAGGKKVARENYRMLAAIIETGSMGNYFLKFIGPKESIDPSADTFKTMIRSLKIVN